MLPILSKASAILLEKPDYTGQSSSISLAKMGYLYLVASLSQCIWPYLILSNADTAKQFAQVGFLGWVFVGIWIGMAWVILHLFYIGVRLLMISRDESVVIKQTSYDKSKMRTIALLLILGILIDGLLLPHMLSVEDKGTVILFSGLFGARVLQANMEAVFQYHRI